MVRTNLAGVRVHVQPQPARCRVEHEKSMLSDREPGRITDVMLADEATSAAWAGNVVKFGMNDGGPRGVGSAIISRKHEHFFEFYTNDGQTLALYGNRHDVFGAMLRMIRDSEFRVIAFGDPRTGRPFSALHSHSIEFTDGKQRREYAHTRLATVCQQASPSRADVFRHF